MFDLFRGLATGRITICLTALAALWLSTQGGPAGAAQIQLQPIPVRVTIGEVLAFRDAATRHLNYLPGQVLVKFKNGTSRAAQQRALMALRSRPALDDLKWIGSVAIVTDAGQPDAPVLAAQLREQPEVAYAEPNYLYRTTSTPNDPSFTSRQWNLQALDLPRTWDISPGGSNSLIVAVVDSGVTTATSPIPFRTWNGSDFVDIAIPFAVNPDLPASRLVSPQDFGFLGGSTVLDTEGHGTHVASTIGEETNNGIAEAGIAYGVRIMPVKVCVSYWDVQFAGSALGIPGFAPPDSGGCLNSDVAQGIRYAADNGAKVINLSLGGPSPSQTVQDALLYAVSKGAFVAVAAGNDYDDDNPTEYPAAFASSIDGVMAVGAVGRSLRHAYYSSSGPYVEIAAPGGDEEEAGTQGGIWQSTIFQPDSDPELVLFPRFDRYAETPFQGTSMASPHVAGIAALIMSRLGASGTPAVVERVIKATARACDSIDCDPATPGVGKSGRNDLFGAGLIQPRAALLGFGFAR